MRPSEEADINKNDPTLISVAVNSSGVPSDLEDEETHDLPAPKKVKVNHVISEDSLYLDTINRSVLDFDFEKVCCISLSNINIYACLVCGKYYQGVQSFPLLPCSSGKRAPRMVFRLTGFFFFLFYFYF
jgi:hypothetical protein